MSCSVGITSGVTQCPFVPRGDDNFDCPVKVFSDFFLETNKSVGRNFKIMKISSSKFPHRLSIYYESLLDLDFFFLAWSLLQRLQNDDFVTPALLLNWCVNSLHSTGSKSPPLSCICLCSYLSNYYLFYPLIYLWLD